MSMRKGPTGKIGAPARIGYAASGRTGSHRKQRAGHKQLRTGRMGRMGHMYYRLQAGVPAMSLISQSRLWGGCVLPRFCF
jgi:hypothetical protein